MTPEQVSRWNDELRDQSPQEITRWAVAHANGRAVVSTNFRPYEAAILHLATQAQPRIPVLWVDHGYNRPATYLHAEALRASLNLDIRPYLPKITAAHRDAVYGPIPDTNDETALKQFSAQMKLEPFQRGMKELAPLVWITALRKSQNPNRAGWISCRWTRISARSRSARFSTRATRTWKTIFRLTTCPTNGITSIPPRPTKNASAACTPPGAGKR